MDSLSASRYHYEHTIYFMITILSASRFYYEFAMDTINIKFTLNSLSYSRNHYDYTILDPKSIWIHYLLRQVTLNRHFLGEITLNSLSFWEITINPLSASQFSFEFTIFFAISLWSHYLIREITMNSRFFSRFHYKFTIFFANSP